jgi:uncharacterized membrane protein YagU involved in acid resistance
VETMTGHAEQHAAAKNSLMARVLHGAIGGLIAGAVFIAITMWFATSMGDPARGPLMMISTIVLGEEAMSNGEADAAVGLAVHAVLSAAFGIVFGVIAPMLRTNGTAALVGTAYGVALYLVNFLVVAPIAYPVFKMANQPFELVVHALFGTLLGFAFYRSGVRRGEPILALNRH